MHIFSPYVVTGSAGVYLCEVFLLCFTGAFTRSTQLPTYPLFGVPDVFCRGAMGKQK